jgi:hypothetical protein
MNAAINRTCRASNASVNPPTKINSLPTNICSAVFPAYTPESTALFEFHRSICDQTIETSVLLTKVEELIEDHVQPLIGKLRKWGCDASLSLQIPLKLPHVCLMENSPFSKADFISAGSSSISSIYTGIHLE